MKKNKILSKVMYGLLASLIILSLIFSFSGNNQSKKTSGLRIDKNYIKSIKPCQQEVNDVYLAKMIEFADKCNGSQKFFRLVNKDNLIGVNLWCGDTNNSFSFYFSDKWRQENYGKK